MPKKSDPTRLQRASGAAYLMGMRVAMLNVARVHGLCRKRRRSHAALSALDEALKMIRQHHDDEAADCGEPRCKDVAGFPTAVLRYKTGKDV